MNEWEFRATLEERDVELTKVAVELLLPEFSLLKLYIT